MTTSFGGLLSGILLLVVESSIRNGGSNCGSNCFSTSSSSGGGGLGGGSLVLNRTLSTTTTTMINDVDIISIICHDSLLVLCSLITLVAGIPLGTYVLLYHCTTSFL